MVNIFDNKCIKIVLVLTLIIFTLGITVGCKSKAQNIPKKTNTSKGEADIIIEKSNISERDMDAEEIIRNSFKYRSEDNLDKTLECYIDRYKDYDFRLNNLEYMEIVDLKLLTDELQYKECINNILLNENNLKVESIKIYEVKYYIEYKDEKLEPTNSGETSKQYILIKLEGSDKWLIEAIGTM